MKAHTLGGIKNSNSSIVINSKESVRMIFKDLILKAKPLEMPI
jgi:hypothetical protein